MVLFDHFDYLGVICSMSVIDSFTVGFYIFSFSFRLVANFPLFFLISFCPEFWWCFLKLSMS
jgi:hypothetical protein